MTCIAKRRLLKKQAHLPATRFRVYGWNTCLYFLVFVWHTKTALLDGRVSRCLPRSDCNGYVISYDQIKPGSPRRKRPIVGEIHFFKGRLGTEAITHESFHATASLLRRLKFDFSKVNDDSPSSNLGDVKSGEEIVATVQGKLARAIVTRLYDCGIL